MKDGLSRTDRLNRIDSVEAFSLIEDDLELLLQQAETIAGFIRYHNLSGQHEGYFDQFLESIKTIRKSTKEPIPTGETEPAQALLLTFIQQLREILTSFNNRWKKYLDWYLNDIVKVLPAPPCPDSTWITFNKNSPKPVFVRKGTGFTFDGTDPENKIFFRTLEPIKITDTVVDKAYSLHFDKNRHIYPASLFGIPTALRMKNLLNENKSTEVLFDDRVNPKQSQPIGLYISTPMLLLREGKRFITFLFEPEQGKIKNRNHLRNLVYLLRKIQQDAAPISRKDAKEVLLVRVFSDIFYLEISTSYGWSPIEKYVIERSTESSHNRNLMLQFELHEQFPETVACDIEKHRTESRFPALRILLNRNAWLYPYSWLKDFLIVKIEIRVEALGINNVLFYNELGKVDNSVPFSPFGNNAEQGARFVIGNYEMAVKNVQSASLRLCWQQLPTDEGGLFSYYRGYKRNINNRSFQLKAKYLSEYKWKDTSNTTPFFLFSSIRKDKGGGPDPQTKLSDETFLQGIRLNEMKPVIPKEEEYDYTIRSKSGFFSFVMTGPEIGFGEKAYRQLFSEELIKKTFRKKNACALNPPVSPLIERITLSYRAVEKLDFRACPEGGNTIVSHIYPFGIEPIYPTSENKPMPFCFSLDTDANILFGLKNAEGDEFINLFIDFFPQKKEIPADRLPRVRWYLGDGYRWKVLPDETIQQDTTHNLLTSGKIKIYLPDLSGFQNKDGITWLRAGITENEKSISEINKIYTNTVKVVREVNQMNQPIPEGFVLNTSEETLPGIESPVQITPVKAGHPEETNQLKLIRISEFITHRDRAVTGRDYERMILQAFPEVSKVKCLANLNVKKGKENSSGTVSVVIIPSEKGKGIRFRPHPSPELLLDIEGYLASKTSSFVRTIDAINPLYEEILVRCAVRFHLTEQSKAVSRAIVKKVINRIIAPWQQQGELPVFGYSFTLQQLKEKIETLTFVKKIDRLSVVQLSLSEEEGRYRLKEYKELQDTVRPNFPHGILVPFEHHLIGTDVNEAFGIEEMEINENFVIWQNETEKH